MDDPAYRFFFRSYHEPYATDRFLSAVVALENILVNDTDDRTNIRYKFMDRGGFLLQRARPQPEGADIYCRRLGTIYDRRSGLVHSARSSLRDWVDQADIDVLRDADDYVRTLLSYLLRVPDLRQSGAVDRLKRSFYA